MASTAFVWYPFHGFRILNSMIDIIDPKSNRVPCTKVFQRRAWRRLVTFQKDGLLIVALETMRLRRRPWELACLSHNSWGPITYEYECLEYEL